MADSLTKAYLLHTRPYRETSMLLDVLTESKGRVSLIAKGVRGKKQSKSGLLQLFSPLAVNFMGRSDLQTLTQCEPLGHSLRLTGHYLYSGLYLNELLVRLLQRQDEHPEIFVLYELAIRRLADKQTIEPTLREFELNLLAELGYGVNFVTDEQGQDIKEGQQYLYLSDGHFEIVEPAQTIPSTQFVVDGQTLLAIQNRDWTAPKALTMSKQIIRIALGQLIGPKPLTSRTLFRSQR